MNDEDHTAAKLKGYNCLVKFRDGEELYVQVKEIEDETKGREWFLDVERFLNSGKDYFPLSNFAFCADEIKYVRKI